MKMLFIGAGKMATALAAGIVKNQLLSAADLLACDISAEARRAFTATTGVRCEPTAQALVADADVLLLAVKPQVAAAVAAELMPIRQGALVISICAGIGINKLQQWFKTGNVVRVMPNTPLMVGKGASAYALGPDANADAAVLVGRILGSLGLARQVDEPLLDAVTALSGSGPAYVFEMAKAMADAGEEAGLPADLALDLSIQTIAGAAEMLARRIGTPDELRDAVTSPNGTTAAGLAVMAQREFRAIMRDVIAAARKRSIELGS
jgi:pyrroline-5-carboxylate reductase